MVDLGSSNSQLGGRPGQYNVLTLGCHSESGEARKLARRKTLSGCLCGCLLLSGRRAKKLQCEDEFLAAAI